MKKLGWLLLVILALVAINIFAEKPSVVADIRFKISFNVDEKATVPSHFADTLRKAEQLLSRVFSSADFKEALYKQNYNDSAYSKSKKKCFEVVYDQTTGRIPGKAVYDNLLADKEVNLTINIKNNGDKKGTMGSSNACSYSITTYDYWLVENGELAQRLARHIAHEFTHVRGFRHDNKVDKAYKWGRKTEEDPAYGVGNIVGEILKMWSKKGMI
ncbi:hypothetical protein [Nubsella zeaxanthinifaciens]|uniref:hypothetical protein n=1 Tax=Nubsella zeaxanthinifaciens TaxID=392412 RepID=UPI000DE26FBD|nr:hypothetical protein [Nubsella zeaxanthinifaciens]